MTEGFSQEPRSIEQRLRRTAERRGLKLTKSRRRDPLALDFGVWTLTDAAGRTVATGSLQDIDAYMRKGARDG